MPRIYRISKGPDIGNLVNSNEALLAFARENGPGRYQVDEHAADPFTGSNAKARGCGTVIHQPDGQVAFKRFFFGNHYIVQDSRTIDRQFPLEFRSAYLHASRWIELVGFKDTSSRQEFAKHLGQITESIRTAIMRQIKGANHRVVRAAVMSAVDDAIQGRKRRW